jgi:type I restriction enzyme M protein
MQDCNLHTILPAARHVYAIQSGCESNVVFFQKGLPTENVWILMHAPMSGITKKNARSRPNILKNLKSTMAKTPTAKAQN